MSIKLGDLSGVEAWRPGMQVPPGSYLAKIDNAEEGTSTGGYPQIIVTWTIVGGDFDGADLRDWIVITETTRGKVVALLKAAGVEIGAGDFELRVDSLIGKQAQIVVIREPGRDDPSKLFSKVAGYKVPPESNGSGGSGNTSGDHEAPLPF